VVVTIWTYSELGRSSLYEHRDEDASGGGLVPAACQRADLVDLSLTKAILNLEERRHDQLHPTRALDGPEPPAPEPDIDRGP